MAALANNPNIAANLRETFPNPYALADAEDYIAEALADERNISRAIEWNGELAGCISLVLEDFVSGRDAEIGCWLGEKFWGRGIAIEAVRIICRAGFEEFGVDRIYAGVFEHNRAAAKVLERCGFELRERLREAICKDGRLFDARLYDLRAEDWRLHENSTDNNSGDAERLWEDDAHERDSRRA